MLKSLYPHVDWQRVRAVGCDMDGTLYDEAEFIAQVYRPVAAIIAAASGGRSEPFYVQMLRRWLEKGSSYSRIFDEALAAAGVGGAAAVRVVDECLAAFRGFDPVLTLPVRVQTILGVMAERFPLFLVSDGSEGLQRRKFSALGLQRWFEPASVAFCAAAGCAKPDTRILREIRVLRDAAAPAEVVYFGDRQIDARFAANAGFNFIAVACMQPVAISEQHEP